MKLTNSLLKFTAIGLIIILLTASLIYWLWQRQPLSQKNNQPTPPTNQEENTQNEIEEKSLKITPKNNTVLTNNEINLLIESKPNELVIIYSNFTQSVGKTDTSGKFDVKIELEDGLNPINIATLSENLEETQSRLLSFYVQTSKDITRVFAGPVKSIFDEIITLTTADGEQTIRKKTSTKLILPSGETDKEDSAIRVGDYLIALGNVESEKDFNAISIEVIRINKPQNVEGFAAGITLSQVNNNLFSIKNQKDSKIAEFTLHKNTTISLNGQESQIDKITKDNKAIVIYHPDEGENIADLVYLLLP